VTCCKSLTNLITVIEEFEDTKGAIIIRISKKNRQHNGQKKKYKMINNNHIYIIRHIFIYWCCRCKYNFTFLLRPVDLLCDDKLIYAYAAAFGCTSSAIFIAHFLSFLCCVFCFDGLRPVSCIPNVVSFVFLDCSFLISPSVFSNLYFQLNMLLSVKLTTLGMQDTGRRPSKQKTQHRKLRK
jgi:hypothetical protein